MVLRRLRAILRTPFIATWRKITGRINHSDIHVETGQFITSAQNAARQHIADPGGVIVPSFLYPSQSLTLTAPNRAHEKRPTFLTRSANVVNATSRRNSKNQQQIPLTSRAGLLAGPARPRQSGRKIFAPTVRCLLV
jgi:hypothetical protein